MKYTIAKNISYRELENEVVVLNLSNGLYYTLNDTSSNIWKMLFVKKMAVQKIVDGLHKKYKQDTGVIKADVKEQLDYWLKEKLIAEQK
ncbi:MAG: PqqD family protein [Elusimicrobiota bacterium]